MTQLLRERIAALGMLALSVAYGVMASRIELYAGVEQEALSPRGFPYLLAGLGVMLSLSLLLRRAAPAAGSLDTGEAGARPWGRVLVLCGLMVLYGLTLRRLGFLLATVLFLGGCLYTLGERRRLVLLGVPLGVALTFYALLRGVLGIYLADPWLEWLSAVGRRIVE